MAISPNSVEIQMVVTSVAGGGGVRLVSLQQPNASFTPWLDNRPIPEVWMGIDHLTDADSSGFELGRRVTVRITPQDGF